MSHNPDTPPPSDSPTSRVAQTMGEFALLYAKEGLRVLPLHTILPDQRCSCGQMQCSSIAKHPITANGVKNATSNAEQLKAWWKQHPSANIGIATGLGLLVIDIDPRHGGSLEALQALVDLPTTAIVRTGGGGFHLYFSYDPQLKLRNTAGKLAPGIDTRADGGYVVAPPSFHASGMRYHWQHRPNPPYTRAPEELLQLLIVGKSTASLLSVWPVQSIQPVQPIHPISPAQTAASTECEPEDAEPLPADCRIPEGKRHSELVRWAGVLRHHGANEEVLLLIINLLNEAFCEPFLPYEEVRQIACSAMRWPTGGVQERDQNALTALTYIESLVTKDRPPKQWAIPGLLPQGVTLLAGKPKMGKSWLALALALAIASGQPSLGHLPTCQGEVLYLGLEDDEQRICDRVLKLLGGEPLPQRRLTWGGFWSPLQMGGLADLETWIKGTQEPRLIVIDTLARVRPHGSQSGNIYADDYAVITPLKQLAEDYHLSILLVHHLRKSSANDPMDEISGSTGLTGATDCNMVLQRERGQREATLHITGRDVTDQQLSLLFDEETGHWSLHETRPTLSPERQVIVELLESMDRALSPQEMASMLDIDYDTIRKRLSLMKKSDQVQQVGRGLYQLKPDLTSTDRQER